MKVRVVVHRHGIDDSAKIKNIFKPFGDLGVSREMQLDLVSSANEIPVAGSNGIAVKSNLEIIALGLASATFQHD